MKSLICSSLLALASAQVFADTAATGTIRGLDEVGLGAGASSNADTRVYLNGVTTFCSATADASFAFIDANDANYRGVVAALLFAYGMGKSVAIYAGPSSLDGSAATGFCRITWVRIQN